MNPQESKALIDYDKLTKYLEGEAKNEVENHIQFSLKPRLAIDRDLANAHSMMVVNIAEGAMLKIIEDVKRSPIILRTYIGMVFERGMEAALNSLIESERLKP